ncbi:MAG: hypothetical protein EBX03_11735 [Rhodobacteraceae bacterium]|nr:hypothetical protein [Paracoccaceae bacterium]
MDVNKVVKVCASNLLNFFKNTLIHFGFAKRFLLLGRLRKPSDQKLSWEDTYQEMAASDEDWSDWDVTVNDGLDGDKMKAKIDKFAGIADKNLSTEEIMNLTRE